MLLPEICIKRPVFATVLSLIILLVGLISYSRLSVREYPRIDEPVVSVTTTYRGASAEVVESQVTKPLEDSLAGIEGVEVMTSQSRSEVSQINVRFTLKRDPDSAAADVRDKVSRVRGKLPDTIDEPIIAKVEADSNPVIYIAVQAGSLSPLEASDYVKRYVQPRLSVLPGASDVRVFGERQVSMRVESRPYPPRRLQADGAGRRGRDPPAERRNPGGAHRVDRARIHRRRRDRPADPRAVQQHHHCQRRRLSGAHPRRRFDGDRRRRRAHRLALQRRTVAQHRRGQASGGESARAFQGGARRGRAHQRDAAAGHEAHRFVRHFGVHRALDRLGVRDHRRGDPAGRAGDLLLPAQPARDADSDRHDSRVADRRVRADVRLRLHDQHADAAGDGAGDRSGRRRRDRGAGEHLPPRRGRHAAQGSGDRRRARDRLRGHRDDADAGVGVRAAGVRHRTHRTAVHRVRADARRRGAGIGVRRADAVADDVLAPAAPSRAPFVDIQPDRGLDRGTHSGLSTRAERAVAAPLAGGAGVGRRGRAGRRLFHAAQIRTRAARRPRRDPRACVGTAGLDPAVHRGPDQADRGAVRADPGKPAPISRSPDSRRWSTASRCCD